MNRMRKAANKSGGPKKRKVAIVKPDEPKKRKKAPTPQEIQAARQKRLDNKLARKKTKAEIAKVKSNKRASDQSNRRNGKKETVEHRRKMEVIDTLYKK